MEILQECINKCIVATAFDAVSKTECCYTFHTPYTTNKGILVSLETFMGTIDSMSMLNEYDNKAVFVRIVKERIEKTKKSSSSGDNNKGNLKVDEEEQAAAAVPTKLAIGVEGGFQLDADKYEIITKSSVVVMEKTDNDNNAAVAVPPKILAELPYSEETKMDFPERIQMSVDSILHHAGVATQQDVQAWQDDEDIPISKYANDKLPYIDNGIFIDPNSKNWKCQKSGDTENLWLNLSDGYIGGGRKNWDGSGGSNGALDHFEETGKQYPLVVKLGTISSDLETADCYSYAPDEDGPVKIPNLAALLEKRGIKVASMQKTVKSTAELEVELNANYAFDAITEAGEELQEVSGPGLQGLQNLGNSCYMNSIFQMLLSGPVPELSKRYGCHAGKDVDVITQHPFLRAVAATVAPTDVLCQTSKLACALTSGAFARPVVDDGEDSNPSSSDPKYRLAPRMMKHCIGKDHVDFRTQQQQDAAQFLQYFLERLDRAELGASSKAKAHLVKSDDRIYPSSHLFSFRTTARLVCGADSKVKYADSAPETIWSLRIPMDKAKVAEDAAIASPEQKKLKSAEEKVESNDKKPVPSISLQTCVEEWAGETSVDDLRWPHLGNATHAAKQTVRIANFPRYLLLQVQRYELGPDWVPKKLEVEVDVPEVLDLTEFKSTGPQDGESLVPDEDPTASSPAVPSATAIDEAALAQLMDMGFSLNSCKRALTAVGGSNVDAAMSWVFEHNMDPDFNDPLPDSSGADNGISGDSSSGVDEGVVQSLVASLGAFSADQIRAALKTTNGAADRAADWLFSHMDDLDGAIAALNSESATAPADKEPSIPLDDAKEGKYFLSGMVSHIGKNTGSGHYVAHLKKDGKWVIFNDEKVALSSKPPFKHAYLYLYQRNDSSKGLNPNY